MCTHTNDCAGQLERDNFACDAAHGPTPSLLSRRRRDRLAWMTLFRQAPDLSFRAAAVERRKLLHPTCMPSLVVSKAPACPELAVAIPPRVHASCAIIVRQAGDHASVGASPPAVYGKEPGMQATSSARPSALLGMTSRVWPAYCVACELVPRGAWNDNERDCPARRVTSKRFLAILHVMTGAGEIVRVICDDRTQDIPR